MNNLIFIFCSEVYVVISSIVVTIPVRYFLIISSFKLLQVSNQNGHLNDNRANSENGHISSKSNEKVVHFRSYDTYYSYKI